MFNRNIGRKGHDICVIFVHAGAGYHSIQNEEVHLQACNDAARAAMAILKAGGSAVDAVEIAVKVLEDREITNAGYGSNLSMDGVVECDASIVDHQGRSGGVGAVTQIKNPISLARLIYNLTMTPLSLRRVPPNLLVGQGAVDFAFEHGMSVLPYDALVSPAARERWIRWREDLRSAERRARKASAQPRRKQRNAGIINPLQEDIVQNTLRQAHTEAMLLASGHNSDSVYQRPVNLSKEDKTSPTPSSISSATTLSSSGRISSDDENFTDPRGPPDPLDNPSRNSFINSTQQVPTIASLESHNTTHHQHARDAIMENEVEMSDVDDIRKYQRRSQDGGQDGLSSGSDDGSSSDSTLQLPSLTPSPTLPPVEGPMEGLVNGPLSVPLPPTPPEKAESPTPKSSTPLGHVNEKPGFPPEPNGDYITDTVGALAVDCFGNIACGASSGGIGMKYRGRVGPAALVGVGAAVIPVESEDKAKTTVAAVTSGTGEHMATTMAATICSERLYHGVRKTKTGGFNSTDDDDVIRGVIEHEFMDHPSVKNSISSGAIGVLCLKKTKDGMFLYYGHNTDSFAMASMHSDEAVPKCTMSRSQGSGSIAQGGRAIRFPKKKA
ncbi:N-terminal nucleophile aminohydrolase [Patellaria atrata CBS 101060]|uniref:N-terminal nucleophile aminohydrolase n=1 Tax=Patellaria atrata CBS 101060 TaxID=1346257 RepID=A0A9P4SH96_9PEZI|nr:N-terminal nucleophile aminohydrolase [Patellaria atrata CBS 101060]